MTPTRPKFVPILTSYATRVSGRSVQDLLASSAAMARALADTQRVVGHDGVLCFYAPQVLAESCVRSVGCLYPAEDVPQSRTVAVMLEAIVALRNILPSEVHVFACCPGPAFTLTALRNCCKPNPPELSDYDYVSDVFLALVRAACESGAQGIAVAESPSAEEDLPDGPYRSARKLADFYSVPFIVFLQPQSGSVGSVSVADCVFRLPLNPLDVELLYRASDDGVHEKTPVTTNQDVPADVPVQVLQKLRVLAMS